MKTTMLDGNGLPQTLVLPSQEAVVDKSSNITAANTSQKLLDANANRSGWLLQNVNSFAVIYVNELGATATVLNSFMVPAGGMFPPPGFPVTTAQINVICSTQGAVFIAREW